MANISSPRLILFHTVGLRRSVSSMQGVDQDDIHTQVTKQTDEYLDTRHITNV